MKKIKIYEEFIGDVNLEMILESHIVYQDEFKNILKDIDSDMSKKILGLMSKDIDVNQNYIDSIISKDDTISFYQDNKLANTEFTITYNRFTNKLDLGINLTVIDRLEDSGLDILPKEIETETELKCKFIRQIGEEDPIYKILKLFYNEPNYSLCIATIDDVEYKCLIHNVDITTFKVKRSEMKVGRFVRALLKSANIEFKDKEIEAFVDKYKLRIKVKNDSLANFKEVKGKDIKYWYDGGNYLEDKGTLGSSCMRHSRCQEYFGIYTDNPEKVSLLIYFKDKDDNKIAGRALLWKTDDDLYVMDRIYIVDSSDTVLFIEYAKSKGYLYKESQDYSDYPFVLNGVVLSQEDSIKTITLDTEHDLYPYVDTFKYMSDGALTNDDSSHYEKELSETNGGRCTECDGEGSVTCRYCEGDGTNECSYCDGDGEVSCGDCDGEGEVECGNCEGDGEIECSDCDGSGTTECEDCDGEGCDNCDGGSVTCGSCDGKGKSDCSPCEGSGQIKCGECSNGSVSCGNCDGDGNTECYNCDGEGSVECSEC